MSEKYPQQAPPAKRQHTQPGEESAMDPQPVYDDPDYRAGGKLKGKIAVITGGDSGIGRAVAVAFAKEGADVAIVYLSEDNDAQQTRSAVGYFGARALLIRGDLAEVSFSAQVVNETLAHFGKLNILVNVAGEQHPQADFGAVTPQQLERTFRTNIFLMFYLCQAALPYLESGATIINTASITAYQGRPDLIDYSSTKGAITSFTRALSNHLAPKGIRVNGVAPGPIWTPLVPSTFSPEQVASFGESKPLGRPGQPAELAPAYVYLACGDSSYVSGQMLHVNGGEVVNG